jgi:pyruvate dehydrogenase E1 component alpha subunit
MTTTTERAPNLLHPDGTLEPDGKDVLSSEQLLEALRLMLLSRANDELAVSLQRQGRVNIHAPSRGQEASVVGSALALDPDRDWVAPQYREFAAYIRQGLSPVTVWMARLGLPPMGTTPAGVRLLPVQIAIAAQVPQAVGLAWGLRLQGSDGVVLTYFGDGAASEGDFHEGANLAGVLRAPAVLFCQNNGWAITTPRSRQTAAEAIADRAAGYGMPGVVVDGNDLLAVYKVTSDAVARARAGDGPTLIESVTYRMGMHNTSDDPTRYMAADELDSWAQRDPVDRVRRLVLAEGLLGEEELAELEREVKDELEAAFREAESLAAGVDPVAVMFDNVFADPPARQQRQRSEAERWCSHA